MFGNPPQEQKSLCQSCGIPLSVHSFGTNASGSLNLQYCNYCFQKGGFVEPDITLSEMIQRSATLMEDEDTSREEAYKFAEKTIPGLKRWNKTI